MMKSKKFLVNQRFKLNGLDITQCMGIIENLPNDIFTEENSKIATCLLIEDALLKYQEHFGEEKDFVLYIHKRFGKYHLRITVNGEDFDPLNEFENPAYAQVYSRLMSICGSQLSYRYQTGNNQLTLSLGKRAKLSGVLLLLVAVLCGLIIGWATSLLPESLRIYPLGVLEDVQNIILGLISFAALPVVFFSIIEGITACGSVQNLGQRGIKTIKTFFSVSFVVMMVTCAVGCLVFPQNWQSTGKSSDIFETLRSVFTGIFPSNLLKPFVDGNMLQVVLIGLAIGCVLLVLAEKNNALSTSISNLSDIFSMLMQWFCKLIPIALTCMFAINVLNRSFKALLNFWSLLVVVIVLCILFLFVTVIITSRKTKIKISSVIKGISEPITVGLSTGSTVTAFQSMKAAMIENFGVSKDYAAFALPMGISFFTPNGVLMNLSVLLFISHLAGIPISTGWMFSALLLNFVFAVAAPPVSGGSIAVMTILLTTQGIGEEWFGLALVSLMILDYITTIFRICMLTLVSSCQAEKLGLRE